MFRKDLIEVIILHQAHMSAALKKALHNVLDEKDIPADSRQIFDIVAESQFLIASYLEKNKHIPFVSENHSNEPSNQVEKFYVEMIFPNGMPKLFSQLNFVQKQFLVLRGADTYTMCCKHNAFSDGVAAIKASTLFREKEYTFSIIATENQLREFATLDQVITMAQEKQHKKVAVIYGYIHKFLDVAKACFQDTIKIKVEQSCELFLQNKINELPTYRDGRTEIHSALPPVDCKGYAERAMQLGQLLRQSPNQYPNQNQITASSVQASYGLTTMASAFVTLGVITYGLSALGIFRCCRSKRHAKNQIKERKEESCLNKSQIK